MALVVKWVSNPSQGKHGVGGLVSRYLNQGFILGCLFTNGLKRMR